MAFCTLDTDCVVYDRHAQMPGWTINDGLCHGCAEHTRATLNQLRYDYVDLSQLTPKPDGRNNEVQIFRPKPESSPPVNEQVFNLRGEIAWFVAQVAIAVRRHIRSPARDHRQPVREGYGLDHDVRWLIERPAEIGALPRTIGHWYAALEDTVALDGCDLVLQLRRLHKMARRACGTDDRVITVPGHCRDCNTPSLRRQAEDPEKIWCIHCKVNLSRDEYTRIVNLQTLGPA